MDIIIKPIITEKMTAQAEEMREEAAMLHAEAEALNEKARLLLGIDISQSSYTEGTVYNNLPL